MNLQQCILSECNGIRLEEVKKEMRYCEFLKHIQGYSKYLNEERNKIEISKKVQNSWLRIPG